jgi:hypothetical protein
LGFPVHYPDRRTVAMPLWLKQSSCASLCKRIFYMYKLCPTNLRNDNDKLTLSD